VGVHIVNVLRLCVHVCINSLERFQSKLMVISYRKIEFDSVGGLSSVYISYFAFTMSHNPKSQKQKPYKIVNNEKISK
jgi:hypothetical protein